MKAPRPWDRSDDMSLDPELLAITAARREEIRKCQERELAEDDADHDVRDSSDAARKHRRRAQGKI